MDEEDYRWAWGMDEEDYRWAWGMACPQCGMSSVWCTGWGRLWRLVYRMLLCGPQPCGILWQWETMCPTHDGAWVIFVLYSASTPGA